MPYYTDSAEISPNPQGNVLEQHCAAIEKLRLCLDGTKEKRQMVYDQFIKTISSEPSSTLLKASINRPQFNFDSNLFRYMMSFQVDGTVIAYQPEQEKLSYDASLQ
jgi:hypothetical protein